MSIFLYAEDDENDVFFLERALSIAGINHSLQVVEDGQQAIAYLSGEGPYADRARFPMPFWMFLDLNLPQARGNEILRWIRDRPQLNDLFLVVLTGSECDQELHEVLSLGANGYLSKPPKPERIRELVRDYQAFAQARRLTPQL